MFFKGPLLFLFKGEYVISALPFVNLKTFKNRSTLTTSVEARDLHVFTTTFRNFVA